MEKFSLHCDQCGNVILIGRKSYNRIEWYTFPGNVFIGPRKVNDRMLKHKCPVDEGGAIH